MVFENQNNVRTLFHAFSLIQHFSGQHSAGAGFAFIMLCTDLPATICKLTWCSRYKVNTVLDSEELNVATLTVLFWA